MVEGDKGASSKEKICKGHAQLNVKVATKYRQQTNTVTWSTVFYSFRFILVGAPLGEGHFIYLPRSYLTKISLADEIHLENAGYIGRDSNKCVIPDSF